LFVFERDLEFVVLEEIVFVAAVALGALKAADDEHGDSDRNQNGEYASIYRNPMCQVLHFLVTNLAGCTAYNNLPADCNARQ